MSRSGNIKKREIEPDVLYGSKLVTKFINRMMFDGKKSIAQTIMYKAFEEIEKQSKKNPVSVFETAVNNVMPRMEVRPRRVGGASYQVPVEVRGIRRESLAIRWLITASRNRSNKEYNTFDKKLAAELLDASANKGGAVKKKEETLRAAEANKAFSHFRW